MRLTYHPDLNVAYIRFRERTDAEAVETVTVSDEVNIDVSADGKLYGIELLNANAQLRAADGGRVVVDDGTGTERDRDCVVIRRRSDVRDSAAARAAPSPPGSG